MWRTCYKSTIWDEHYQNWGPWWLDVPCVLWSPYCWYATVCKLTSDNMNKNLYALIFVLNQCAIFLPYIFLKGHITLNSVLWSKWDFFLNSVYSKIIRKFKNIYKMFFNLSIYSSYKPFRGKWVTLGAKLHFTWTHNPTKIYHIRFKSNIPFIYFLLKYLSIFYLYTSFASSSKLFIVLILFNINSGNNINQKF